VTPGDEDQPGMGDDSDRGQEIISPYRVTFNNKIPVPDLSGPLYIGGGRNEDNLLAAL